MAIQLVEDRPSIVAIGIFAPALFHPQWFRAQGLLGESEAKHASMRILVPDFVHWTTDEWLEVQVLPNRFLAQALVESRAEALRDLVVGALQVLDQSSVTALGINRSMHFSVGTEADYHKIGDALAPKEPWAEVLRGRLGMRQLQIEQNVRTDGLTGKTIVTVAPSAKYPMHVVVDVNNDLRLESPAEAQAKSETRAIETISANWSRLFSDARVLAERLLNGVLGS